ncbi:MAG TPA: hypothetical protein VKX49_26520 [Bryobacteraceae bacterium]|nr:hypothetical protein [Bryobacteraceae bacterium]
MTRILFGCLFAVCAAAQPPIIYNRAVVNAASFMPPRLPGGAIAQGSIFSIFGARLGPTTGVQATSFPLGTTLGNISITVTQGKTTVNVIPLFVSAGQINAIMPSNAPVGVASLVVKSSSGQSNPMPVVVAANAFGIFTATGTGLGPGILQNFVTQSNQPINSPNIPAQPGQVITLWGTGLGPVAADNVAPAPGNLATKVEVSVGGVPVTSVLYSGRTPCCSGVDQVVFQVPANAPQGCWVPVSVRTGGAVVSNFVTMAITPDGSACDSTPIGTASKIGAFLGVRVTTHEDIGTKSAIDVTGDYATAFAYQTPLSNFPFNPIFSWAPPGTCTAYAVKGDLLRGDTLPGAVPAGAKALNFGPAFTLSGPNGMKMLQNFLLATPLRYLGGSVTGNFFNNTLFLQPGSYSVTGVGGSDVGGFSTSVNMPQPLTWTNRDQTNSIDRTQPLNVSWSGGSGGQVAIVGFGVDLPTDSTTVFGCLAPPGATSFSVPPAVLANVPPTRPNPLQSKSVIYVASGPDSTAASTLSASGLDYGFIAFQQVLGKTVIFQ